LTAHCYCAVGSTGQPPSSPVSQSIQTIARFRRRAAGPPLPSPPPGARRAGPLLLHPASPRSLKRGRSSPSPRFPSRPFSPSQGARLTRLHPPLGLPLLPIFKSPLPSSPAATAIPVSERRPCLLSSFWFVPLRHILFRSCRELFEPSPAATSFSPPMRMSSCR
jgi:hypothetical protein